MLMSEEFVELADLRKVSFMMEQNIYSCLVKSSENPTILEMRLHKEEEELNKDQMYSHVVNMLDYCMFLYEEYKYRASISKFRAKFYENGMQNCIARAKRINSTYRQAPVEQQPVTEQEQPVTEQEQPVTEQEQPGLFDDVGE